LVGMPDRQNCDLLLESLAFTFGEMVRDPKHPGHAQFAQLARQFADGKNVVFLCMHAEPAAVQVKAAGSELVKPRGILGFKRGAGKGGNDK
jgi:hypothetical protein